ncbi:NAD-dependent epimerase/dehydratase family protein [Schlesneria paludicola]|uniref:NAD-dependent epimerase/dehydratase family protein n=1 Tax=Schlesneria paludicola TaxID=360056 RepID=UPI00029A06BA|nr:NAD(P)-dependent oxidoreductase [Schlesneria paludicola]
MTVLVTGSAGHLGEALMRTLRKLNRDAIGVDVKPSSYTNHIGSIADPHFVEKICSGATHVIHTATLHKPHIATHSHQAFVDTNVTGTLTLLEAAVASRVQSFVFTSTTSTFGSALNPMPGMPAAWITEDVTPIPKNIYGVTKLAAEHLCEMFARRGRLPVIILKTSRFFPEEDDSAEVRSQFSLENVQLNELLYRRVDMEDVVSAHFLAMEKAPGLGFGCYIISAPTPFTKKDLPTLRANPTEVLLKYFPESDAIYRARNWTMFTEVDRVYVSDRAQTELGWRPQWDFGFALKSLQAGRGIRSELALDVGVKGYYAQSFDVGPYPIEFTTPR